MLDKEFKYYKEHQIELVQKYDNKFIVIKNEKVIGVYDTELSAYLETKKEHEVGTFLIQKVSAGSESYTQTFHSRVYIPSGR
jgi:hypothetical protein